LIFDMLDQERLSQTGSDVRLQRGPDDSKQVSVLHPKVEIVREFPLPERR
jgi:hypothetical protein